jgi:hypothetical protein
MSALAPLRLRARQIADDDLDRAADLLQRGFGSRRTRQFWLAALEALKRRGAPDGTPRYGYVLEADGALVGIILLICSALEEGGVARTRCNVSSWYVDPAFRSYAPLLVSQALKHKNVTFMNISSMPHTRPIIEAQGFARYSNGLFVAFPLVHAFCGARAQIVEACAGEATDHGLLLDHARAGCISFWCVSKGAAHPFVFRPRIAERLIPCAQLVYCRAVEDFVRFAGPIGAYLAARGRLPVIVDANGPIPGLAGIYIDGKMPKYFKGPDRPRLGDLAYTETALFGV